MSASLHFDLPHFDYPDIYRAERLPVLDKLFRDALEQADPALAARYVSYRDGAPMTGPAESELLIAVARQLENFLVRAFRVTAARDALRAAQTRDDTIHAFKEKFVKQRARKNIIAAVNPNPPPIAAKPRRSGAVGLRKRTTRLSKGCRSHWNAAA